MKDSTLLVSKIGSMYTSALYVNLLSLIYHLDNSSIGKNILMFSYGSGAMSSLFRFTIRGIPNINKGVCDLLDETKLIKINDINCNPNNLKNNCYYLHNANDNDGRTYKLNK